MKALGVRTESLALLAPVWGLIALTVFYFTAHVIVAVAGGTLPLPADAELCPAGAPFAPASCGE